MIGSNISSEKARAEILALKPDLVVSTLHMKRMGGIGLMNALRTAGAECKFVILTDSWSTEAMRDFIHSGGFDFLQKPLNPQGISTVLERLNDRRGKYKQRAGECI